VASHFPLPEAPSFLTRCTPPRQCTNRLFSFLLAAFSSLSNPFYVCPRRMNPAPYRYRRCPLFQFPPSALFERRRPTGPMSLPPDSDLSPKPFEPGFNARNTTCLFRSQPNPTFFSHDFLRPIEPLLVHIKLLSFRDVSRLTPGERVFPFKVTDPFRRNVLVGIPSLLHCMVLPPYPPVKVQSYAARRGSGPLTQLRFFHLRRFFLRPPFPVPPPTVPAFVSHL